MTPGPDRCVRIAVDGDLDTASAGQFTEAGRQALAGRSATTLVIDMSRVTFIDAAGIGALATLRTHAEVDGNAIVVTAPSACVVRLLDLTGLTERFSA